MNVLVAVISPAPAWVMPRWHVDRLRADFPQHTFLDAWDRDDAITAAPIVRAVDGDAGALVAAIAASLGRAVDLESWGPTADAKRVRR